MADLTRGFRLDDWNYLIQQANAKRLVAIDDGCIAPIDPLLEVTSPHKLSQTDILDMQGFLNTMCSGNFTEPNYWSAQSIIEIENHIESVDPCYCYPEGEEYFITTAEPYFVEFDHNSELVANFYQPITGQEAANAAASNARTEWLAFQYLLTAGASEAAVSAQETVYNNAAAVSTSTANAITSESYHWEPLAPGINSGLIRTSSPQVQYKYIAGELYRRWIYYQTVIRVEIFYRVYYCAPYLGPYTFHAASYRTSPGKSIVFSPIRRFNLPRRSLLYVGGPGIGCSIFGFNAICSPNCINWTWSYETWYNTYVTTYPWRKI